MKKTIYILILILFTSCLKSTDSNKIWTVEFDSVSSNFYMKESNSVNPQTLNQVIEKLNKENPKIQFELIKISNDTANVKIENSEFLTQQCGTAGADSYIAAIVYNLSEFKNIKFINFDFELGDHAVPGTYSRNDFIKF